MICAFLLSFEKRGPQLYRSLKTLPENISRTGPLSEGLQYTTAHNLHMICFKGPKNVFSISEATSGEGW